jgi:hypothetical protein
VVVVDLLLLSIVRVIDTYKIINTAKIPNPTLLLKYVIIVIIKISIPIPNGLANKNIIIGGDRYDVIINMINIAIYNTISIFVDLYIFFKLDLLVVVVLGLVLILGIIL